MNTLYDAINNACGALPDGWQIHIHAENGAAWVELESPDGELHKPQYQDDPMSEQVEQLTGYAIQHA